MYANSVVTILISSWYVLPCIMILCRYLLEYLIYHLRPYGVNMSSHPADHDAVVPKLWQELCDFDLTVQKYCDKKQHKACKRLLEKIEACTWQSRWQIQAKLTIMIWRRCTVTTVIILTGISRDTKMQSREKNRRKKPQACSLSVIPTTWLWPSQVPQLTFFLHKGWATWLA